MEHLLTHYWNVPASVTTAPRGATVVVVSNCGRSFNLPAWQVLEWSARGNTAPPADQACPVCVDIQDTVSRHPAGKAVQSN